MGHFPKADHSTGTVCRSLPSPARHERQAQTRSLWWVEAAPILHRRRRVGAPILARRHSRSALVARSRFSCRGTLPQPKNRRTFWSRHCAAQGLRCTQRRTILRGKEQEIIEDDGFRCGFIGSSSYHHRGRSDRWRMHFLAAPVPARMSWPALPELTPLSKELISQITPCDEGPCARNAPARHPGARGPSSEPDRVEGRLPPRGPGTASTWRWSPAWPPLLHLGSTSAESAASSRALGLGQGMDDQPILMALGRFAARARSVRARPR